MAGAQANSYGGVVAWPQGTELGLPIVYGSSWYRTF